MHDQADDQWAGRAILYSVALASSFREGTRIPLSSGFNKIGPSPEIYMGYASQVAKGPFEQYWWGFMPIQRHIGGQPFEGLKQKPASR